MPRFFYDTEFLELGPDHPLHLVSIGIKCEDGREYYAEWDDCPLHLASDWVKQHVVPHLRKSRAKPRQVIVEEILNFVGSGKPSWWGYFSDYDHVCLAQLFGTMMDMPSKWPKYTLDLKQVWVMLGGPKLPPEPVDEHNALADAKWNHASWLVLNEKWKEVIGVDLP